LISFSSKIGISYSCAEEPFSFFSYKTLILGKKQKLITSITYSLLCKTFIGVPPGKVAVMQICTDSSHCHVLHLIHSGIPPNLQLLLEDPTVLKVSISVKLDFLFFFFCLRQLINYVSINTKFGVRKVGVGIDSDATKVFRDYKISVKGVTDLSFHANQKLGGDHKWGLSSLTEKLLSKQVCFESNCLKLKCYLYFFASFNH